MEWFYANKSDQQVGFEENNFKSLVESGSIKEDTLVWNEDLPDWRPCRDVRPEIFEIAPSAITPDVAKPTSLDVTPPLPPRTGESGNSDNLAIASLVFGILSLLCVPFAGFAAVICGHISRRKLIERTGSTEGGGISLTGLILGYIGILIGILFVLFTVVMVIIAGNSPT